MASRHKVVLSDGTIRDATWEEEQDLSRIERDCVLRKPIAVAMGDIPKGGCCWFSVTELEAGRVQGVMAAEE